MPKPAQHERRKLAEENPHRYLELAGVLQYRGGENIPCVACFVGWDRTVDDGVCIEEKVNRPAETVGNAVEQYQRSIGRKQPALDVFAARCPKISVGVEQAAGVERIAAFIGGDEFHPQLTFEDRATGDAVSNSLVEDHDRDRQGLAARRCLRNVPLHVQRIVEGVLNQRYQGIATGEIGQRNANAFHDVRMPLPDGTAGRGWLVGPLHVAGLAGEVPHRIGAVFPLGERLLDAEAAWIDHVVAACADVALLEAWVIHRAVEIVRNWVNDAAAHDTIETEALDAVARNLLGCYVAGNARDAAAGVGRKLAAHNTRRRFAQQSCSR